MWILLCSLGLGTGSGPFRQGGDLSHFVKGVNFRNIIMNNVQNPIFVRHNYCLTAMWFRVPDGSLPVILTPKKKIKIKILGQIQLSESGAWQRNVASIMLNIDSVGENWSIRYLIQLNIICYANQNSGIKISSVSFSNFRGTSATPVAIVFDCSAKYLGTEWDYETQSSCYGRVSAGIFVEV